MQSLGEESYVQLTTFTRDGRPKPAPVWIAQLADGRVGFTTDGTSWKVRRIQKTPRVELRPCDGVGKVLPDAPIVCGEATLASSADDQAIRAAIAAKYGWQFRLIEGFSSLAKLVGSNLGGGGAAIVIRLSSEDSI
jgi:PPOX class probable F420-dependent enzyme